MHQEVHGEKGRKTYKEAGSIMSTQCHIAGCHNPAESEGLCARHFTRALIYGQVRVTRPRALAACAVAGRADA